MVCHAASGAGMEPWCTTHRNTCMMLWCIASYGFMVTGRVLDYMNVQTGVLLLHPCLLDSQTTTTIVGILEYLD